MTVASKRIAIFLSAFILLGAWAMTVEGYFVCPAFLRSTTPGRADAVAGYYGSAWEDVSMRATDGVTLRGWLFTPQKHRNRAALLVHGGVGNRHEMLSRAEWLIARGYACLLIDQRGCGTSGGRISWGVNEPGDIAAWANWLRDRTQASAVFGYGLSRGSTTLVQSLALKPPFTGVAAEASGAGNIAQPYQFMADKLGLPRGTAKAVTWPLIEPSLLWIRLRYGFDMKRVQDGVAAIRGSEIPVLFIHGSADHAATLAGVERLRDANPRHTDLVVFRGADHGWFGPARPEVMQCVLAWFDVRMRLH